MSQQDIMESAVAIIRAPSAPATAIRPEQPQRTPLRRPAARETIHPQTERKAFRIPTPEVP
ncbi:hypothetical protein ACMAUO_14265 [Gluconacetobacter sp. Hr-1-5]|uniref:hypothetical protein n=1 Tax=Gluconacetobacter sp. Hr-1-5 TaxID=3395370 RepID=UPI003B5244B4